MRIRILGRCAGVMLMVFSIAATAQVTVTGSQNAAVLAQSLAGPGVTILNPVLTCPNIANGVFKAALSNLGIDSGIVLTTGRASSENGTIGVDGGAFNFASTRNNAAGDQMLEPLAGQATHDACALEFDVVPQGDTVKFDYVFGSEEYINATCGPYNDAFAFFISGPGINGPENMALVPGTNIPVTINSINSGVPGPNYDLSGCTSMGPGSPFTNYYTNNASGATVTYQGFTRVLQAYHAVVPCNTYHLKMVIADGGNFIYDSGVFIRAGSLQANTLSILPVGGDNISNRNTATAVKGCAPARFRVKRTQAGSAPETVNLLIRGNAVNGYDYRKIADSVVIPAGSLEADILIYGLPTTAGGIRQVKLLALSPNNCSGAPIADSATITLLDTIQARITSGDTTICKGEQTVLRAEGDSQLTYRWSPAYFIDSTSGKYAVASPAATTKFALLASWPPYGCLPKTDSVQVAVRPVPAVRIVGDDRVCLHDTVLLAAVVTPSYNNYSYTWSGPSGFIAQGSSTQIDDALPVNSGNYVLSVGLDTNRCAGRDTLNLSVIIAAVPTTAPIIFCEGKPAGTLDAQGSQLRWYYEPFGGLPVKTIRPATERVGFINYYVSQQIDGCESERAALPVEVRRCCDLPVFIPTAFTPNGDGHNDAFALRIPGYGGSTARLRIYDRWGQMIFESFDGSSWDGLRSGDALPGGTYFYEAVVNCRQGAQQFFKGDVLLLR